MKFTITAILCFLCITFVLAASPKKSLRKSTKRPKTQKETPPTSDNVLMRSTTVKRDRATVTGKDNKAQLEGIQSVRSVSNRHTVNRNRHRHVVSQKKKLRYVKAMFRHGERAPKQKPYPKDKYDESFWPKGFGVLVEMGEKQAVELGELFYKRYRDFVTQPEELFMQAAPLTRTIDSAKLFIDGFFAAEDKEKREKPHPIHVNKMDPLSTTSNFDCPTYDKIFRSIKKKEESKHAQKYEKFLKFLAEYVNDDENVGKIPTWKDFDVLTQVSREVEMKLPQPWWMDKVWPEFDGMRTHEVIADVIRQNRAIKFSTPQLARLKGGIVLGDYLNDATRVAKNEPLVVNLANGTQLKTSPKMMIYSTRTGPLSLILYAMNLHKEESVSIAGCFILEIYEEFDSQKTLTVELHFGTANKMEKLELKDCGEPCTLKKFTKIYAKKAILSDKSLHEECGRDREFVPDPIVFDVKYV